MPNQTYVDGTAISASTLNANLRDQVITQCTAATHPTPTEGQYIYETDTNKTLGYDGSVFVETDRFAAWGTVTPALSGAGWALGNGTSTGSFVRCGRLIIFQYSITFGSTSTFGGSGLTLSVPATATSVNTPLRVIYTDTSAATNYIGAGYINATTISLFGLTAGTGSLGTVINTVPFTWASTDAIVISGTYEASANS